MNDAVTFFRNRNENKGDTCEFEVTTDKGAQTFFVYTRASLEKPATFADQAMALGEVKGFVDKVSRDVAGRGGGVIVIVSGDENRTVKVRPVSSQGYHPAGTCWILAPAVSAFSVPVEGEKALPAGGHVVVPVDEEAEKRLGNFIGYLSWLSPDLEALVLHAIRRPSLDARLDEVETRLFGRTAEEALSPAAGKQTWLALQLRKWKNPLSYALAFGVLLLVLLVGNGWMLFRINSKLPPPRTNTTATTTTGTATTTTTGWSNPPTSSTTEGDDPPEGQPASASQLVARTKELLIAVKNKNDPDLVKVQANHFSSLDAGADDTTVAGWYVPGDQHFLWGLIKLETLKLKPETKDFLNIYDSFSATARAFSDISAAIKATDPKGVQMVEVAACRLNVQAKFTPPFACKGHEQADLSDALAQLVEYVKTK